MPGSAIESTTTPASPLTTARWPPPCGRRRQRCDLHSDRGSEYTAGLFAAAYGVLGVTQSMGRDGSALDNAAAESFFSTLEFECLGKHRFAINAEARRAVARYIDRYNRVRPHSSCEMWGSPPDRSPRVGGNHVSDRGAAGENPALVHRRVQT